MRINPRQLLYLIPMFMRLPPKMRGLVIIGAIVFFAWSFLGEKSSFSGSLNPSPSSSEQALPVDDLSIGEALGERIAPPSSTSSTAEKTAPLFNSNKYERLKNCRLVSDPYNDGDSFKIKTEQGEELEIRLYFVDTAESRDKPYADHRKRVTEQGDYFGGLGYQKALLLGKAAKKITTQKLANKKLTILTARELVYQGPRIYAFVYVEGIGWWHEYLVKNGLARIHTKGAEMPDGTTRRKRTQILKNLEQDAQSNKVGAWGL